MVRVQRLELSDGHKSRLSRRGFPYLPMFPSRDEPSPKTSPVGPRLWLPSARADVIIRKRLEGHTSLQRFLSRFVNGPHAALTIKPHDATRTQSLTFCEDTSGDVLACASPRLSIERTLGCSCLREGHGLDLPAHLRARAALVTPLRHD